MLCGRIAAPTAVLIEMRQALMGWLRDNGAVVGALPAFIETKLALVVTLLIKQQYVAVWQSAFHELLAFITLVSIFTSIQSPERTYAFSSLTNWPLFVFTFCAWWMKRWFRAMVLLTRTKLPTVLL
jgi:hypothetical protein